MSLKTEKKKDNPRYLNPVNIVRVEAIRVPTH